MHPGRLLPVVLTAAGVTLVGLVWVTSHMHTGIPALEEAAPFDVDAIAIAATSLEPAAVGIPVPLIMPVNGGARESSSECICQLRHANRANAVVGLVRIVRDVLASHPHPSPTV